MSYRIHQSWTTALQNQPETGMGYQLVEVPVGKTTEHVLGGTVQPANGYQGGGDEVIFDQGAPARTRYKQDEIPPGD